LDRLRCVLFPAKAFFGVPSFSYLRHSPMLWVLCAPPCGLHRAQCFAYFWGFFVIWSLRAHPFLGATTSSHACLRPFAFLLSREGLLVHSSTWSSLWTIWCTVPPLSSYWSFQCLGTILRMWLAKLGALNGSMTLVILVACLEWMRQGNRSKLPLSC
jgi:hypothetical protein